MPDENWGQAATLLLFKVIWYDEMRHTTNTRYYVTASSSKQHSELPGAWPSFSVVVPVDMAGEEGGVQRAKRPEGVPQGQRCPGCSCNGVPNAGDRANGKGGKVGG